MNNTRYAFSIGSKQYQFNLENYVLLENGISFNLNREYVDSRKRVYIKTNDVCNFACPYCYQNNNNAFVSYQPIQLRNYSSVEKVIADKEVDLFLFGGEPLLDQEFENVSWLLNNCRNIITIFTNGCFSEKYHALLMCKKENCKVIVTIDGPKEIHNARRISLEGDSFEQIIKNIHVLVSGCVPVRIQINVDSENIAHIPRLFDYFEETFGANNLSVSLNPVLHTAYSLPPIELLALYGRLHQRYQVNDLHVNSRTLLKTVRLLTGQGYDPRRCEIDKTLVFNIPEESIHCCPQSTKTVIGRLSVDGVELFNNAVQEYTGINRKEKAPCSTCDYKNFCGLMCAIDRTNFSKCKTVVQAELQYIFQNSELFLRPR